MNFETWMKKGKEEIAKAVNQNMDQMNDRQKSLVPVFLQYNMLQKTQHLVIATWILAILTVLVNIIIVFIK